MIVKFEDLDPNGTYTFADYLTWQFKERVELIKDKIFKMAMPSEKHQRVSGNLYGLVWAHLKGQKYKAYHPLFDVRLVKPPHLRKVTDKSIYTVVQPDLAVVCDMNKVDDKGCLGAPDLVVEILSPSTGDKDLNDKKIFMNSPKYQSIGLCIHKTGQSLSICLMTQKSMLLMDSMLLMLRLKLIQFLI
jgi:Uma2 family endonuclease